jgi:hypothetical protein
MQRRMDARSLRLVTEVTEVEESLGQVVEGARAERARLPRHPLRITFAVFN